MTEIFVENNRVDVTADISALLTFALDDVKDFSSRQTTFSKTVVLPGTANNNRLFGNVFNTGSTNYYDAALNNTGYNFNAAKSAAVIIFQDNLQTFQGKLRLLTIVRNGKNIEYEVAMFGNLTALNVALEPSSITNTDGTTTNNSGYLENLDFSEYNHAYNETSVTGSWDNDCYKNGTLQSPLVPTYLAGAGYYYPLIDYGNYSSTAVHTAHTAVRVKRDWLLPTFRPALYVKEYIDKMFKAAGFSYTSSLFDTQRFKNLVVPCNTKLLYTKVTRILYAAETTTHTIIDSAHGDTHVTVPWDNRLAGAFTYSGGVFTYTGTGPLNIIFSWRLTGHNSVSAIPPSTSFTINIKHNGTSIKSRSFSPPPFSQVYGWDDNVSLVLSNGDTVQIDYDYSSGTSMLADIDAGCYMQLDSDVPQLVPIAYGQTVTLNDVIPRNIKQIDFLVSIVKLFNLYVWEDANNPTHIYIAPFVDYYSGDTGNSVDWTYKLNRDKTVTIKPMSELTANTYNFKMANDSDYYNDLYKKRFNQNYGDYIFNSQYEFSTDSQDCQLIFAGTPLVGYDSELKVYSTIFKRTGDDNTPTEEQTDSIIRILQTKKVTGLTASWDLYNMDGSATLLTGLTNYGYAGHFDDPDAPANDLNFGALQQLLFTLATGDLSNTQFNVYWSPYMAEITDKDSKLVTANFYLTPIDIYHLDFSKYIYVDGVLFRLNKIIDYNASTPTDCKVELLRVINTKY